MKTRPLPLAVALILAGCSSDLPGGPPDAGDRDLQATQCDTLPIGRTLNCTASCTPGTSGADAGLGATNGSEDAGFEQGSECSIRFEADGTYEEGHGDNFESGTWTCAGGQLALQNEFTSRNEVATVSDGCVEAEFYRYH